MMDWEACLRASARLLDITGNTWPRDPRGRLWAEVIANELGIEIPREVSK